MSNRPNPEEKFAQCGKPYSAPAWVQAFWRRACPELRALDASVSCAIASSAISEATLHWSCNLVLYAGVIIGVQVATRFDSLLAGFLAAVLPRLLLELLITRMKIRRKCRDARAF